jgi:pimeloyl-ACP methyl ester carboxylesterase
VAAAKEHWLNDELFAPARQQPTVSARLRQMVSDYSGWHWVNHDPGSWADVPAIQRLDQLRLPTLILVGERDLPDFHRAASLIQTQAANARLVVLPGMGHMSNMEAPEAFNAMVLRFLAEIERDKV